MGLSVQPTPQVPMSAGAGVGVSMAPMLRIRDVARILTVGVRTLERLIADGKFPAPDRRAGCIRIWRPETVQAWLNRC